MTVVRHGHTKLNLATNQHSEHPSSTGHPDKVDLMVGMYAETPPEGFGFSATAFRVFILMASRRILSDRSSTTTSRLRYDQASLFYELQLDQRVPKDHLLWRIDVFVTAWPMFTSSCSPI
jgi:hypothetical protein